MIPQQKLEELPLLVLDDVELAPDVPPDVPPDEELDVPLLLLLQPAATASTGKERQSAARTNDFDMGFISMQSPRKVASCGAASVPAVTLAERGLPAKPHRVKAPHVDCGAASPRTYFFGFASAFGSGFVAPGVFMRPNCARSSTLLP